MYVLKNGGGGRAKSKSMRKKLMLLLFYCRFRSSVLYPKQKLKIQGRDTLRNTFKMLIFEKSWISSLEDIRTRNRNSGVLSILLSILRTLKTKRKCSKFPENGELKRENATNLYQQLWGKIIHNLHVNKLSLRLAMKSRHFPDVQILSRKLVWTHLFLMKLLYRYPATHEMRRGNEIPDAKVLVCERRGP